MRLPLTKPTETHFHVSPRYLRRLTIETARVERVRARQLEAGERLTACQTPVSPPPTTVVVLIGASRGARCAASPRPARPPAAVVG